MCPILIWDKGCYLLVSAPRVGLDFFFFLIKRNKDFFFLITKRNKDFIHSWTKIYIWYKVLVGGSNGNWNCNKDFDEYVHHNLKDSQNRSMVGAFPMGLSKAKINSNIAHKLEKWLPMDELHVRQNGFLLQLQAIYALHCSFAISFFYYFVFWNLTLSLSLPFFFLLFYFVAVKAMPTILFSETFS